MNPKERMEIAFAARCMLAAKPIPSAPAPWAIKRAAVKP